MKFKIILSVAITILLCHKEVISQKFSNEFLAIGVNARSLGMAGTHVAIVEDVSAGYWNPAGLHEVKSFELSAMHAEWFAGIGKFDYLGIALPLKKNDYKSSIGLNFIRLGIDNIPNTFNLIEADGTVNYNNLTSFSAADYAFFISYGRELRIPGVSIGTSAKIIHRNVGDFANAWGFGIDVGAKYIKDKWQFGILARDLTSTFNAWNFNYSEEQKAVFKLTDNDITASSLEITKPKFILGASRMVDFSQKISLLSSIDVDITTDGERNTILASNVLSFDPHAGIELGYDELFFLRGGIGNFQKVTQDIGNSEDFSFQPNIGVGVLLGKVNLDYALTDIGNVSNALYSHVFSLTIDLSKINRIKEARNKRNAADAPSIIIEQID